MLFIEKKYEFQPVVLPNEVTVTEDIPYMEGQRHTFDMYVPENNEKKLPVIIDIYGGGLYFGEKSSYKLQNSMSMVKKGYIVLSPNYSLIWQEKFPTQIYEIKALIRFVKANADKYNFDASKIVLSGESSGAHLAVLTAVTASQGVMRNVLFGDNPNYNEEVNAVIASYGPYEFDTMKAQFEVLGIEPNYSEVGEANSFEGQMFEQQKPSDNPELVKKYNPVTYFNSRMPAMLVLAGKKDQVVPVMQSQNLVVSASKYLSPDKLAWRFYDNAVHGPKDFNDPILRKLKVDKLNEWLN